MNNPNSSIVPILSDICLRIMSPDRTFAKMQNLTSLLIFQVISIFTEAQEGFIHLFSLRPIGRNYEFRSEMNLDSTNYDFCSLIHLCPKCLAHFRDF